MIVYIMHDFFQSKAMHDIFIYKSGPTQQKHKNMTKKWHFNRDQIIVEYP